MSHVSQQLLGVFFFCCGFGLTIAYLILDTRRTEELMEELPPERRFELYTFQTHMKMAKEYKHFYSLHGPKDVYPLVCILSALICHGLGFYFLFPH